MFKKMLVIPALMLTLGLPSFAQSYQSPYYDSNDANNNGGNYNNYAPPANYNAPYYPPASYNPAPNYSNSSNLLNGLLTSVLTRALTQQTANNSIYSPYNNNSYNNNYQPYNNSPYNSYAPYNEPYGQTGVNNLVLPLITTVLQQALRHP